MTVWVKTNRGWVDEANPDEPARAAPFMKDGDTCRVPIQFTNSAGGQQQQMLDALADRAADPRLDPAARVAARDALHRQYAALAAVPTNVIRNPGLFDETTREAVLVAPVAGRDTLEAVYAAYSAHIRDAWRGGKAPCAAGHDLLDAAYADYSAHITNAWRTR